MTDIMERLAMLAVFNPPSAISTAMEEAADEITRLRSGLMKSVQYDNKCDQTGRSCQEDGHCGCQKEAETWLE